MSYSKVIQDIKLDFKDVLIVPQISSVNSRSDVNLERTFKFKYYPNELTCIPIIASNMSTVGTISMQNKLSKLKILTVLNKFVIINDETSKLISKDYTFLSCGVNDYDSIIAAIDNYGFDKICIDIANGYIDKIIETIQFFRSKYPHLLIMAGNVATNIRCSALIKAGADIVKIGIGSGSACLTRLKTGVGYPQLSCILDSVETTHLCNGLIVSDGGCSSSADICKAFGAGADFVMLGGMLAGHFESEGDIMEVKGQKKMLLYGMSSKIAQDKFNGGMNSYRTSEGRCMLLDYRGNIIHTIQDILGGLRSYGTYIGCDNIVDFADHTTFIRVNQQLNNPYD
jgi:GMP reductase